MFRKVGMQLIQSRPGTLLTVQWPQLIPFGIAAAIMGLVGFFYLLRQSKRDDSKATSAWAFSFLWFSLMGLVAPGFSLLTVSSLNTPIHLLWRALDVGFTACACAQAIKAVFFIQIAPGDRPRTSKPTPTASTETPTADTDEYGWNFFRSVHVPSMGIDALLLAMSIAGNLQQVPFISELLYTLMVISCFTVVGVRLYRLTDNRSKLSHYGTRITWCGLAVVLAGFVLDRPLCYWFGPGINLGQFWFGGCTLMYAGLLTHLIQ